MRGKHKLSLKRVPMDFDWPLGEQWPGYKICNLFRDCDQCHHFARLNGESVFDGGCPRMFGQLPFGRGYQLWRIGLCPISPVFATLDELCQWCTDNDIPFVLLKATKEEWKELLLEKNFSNVTQGNVAFYEEGNKGR